MTAADDRLLSTVQQCIRSTDLTVMEACFRHTKDFSFSWRVNGKMFCLYVPDYLDNAPDIVLSQFVQGAISFIYKGKHVFGTEYMEYMTSDAFILEKRPIFFARSRQLTRSDIGKHRALYDSVQRLMDQGLLAPSDIRNTVFSWSANSNRTRLGYCAQLFRVVMISSVFDDPSVPERLLDYVVYHECLHLRQGYVPFNRHPHDAEFHRNIRLFPDYEKIEKELRNILH